MRRNEIQQVERRGAVELQCLLLQLSESVERKEENRREGSRPLADYRALNQKIQSSTTVPEKR